MIGTLTFCVYLLGFLTCYLNMHGITLNPITHWKWFYKDYLKPDKDYLRHDNDEDVYFD